MINRTGPHSTGLGSTGPRADGLRSELVRQSNLAAILNTVHLGGALSRSDLVLRTGLSRSAVGGLVGALVDLNLVVETRSPSDGNTGRPSPIVKVHATRNVVLAMEVLVDSVAVAAVGLGGSLLLSVRSDRPRAHLPAHRTVQDLSDLARQITARLPADCGVFGVGVAVAGLVRRTDNMVLVAPNIGWHDVPLGALLSEALHLDVPITVSNDADLGALAESRRGAAAGLNDVLYVSGEVGVGGGVISGGRAMSGSGGFAGEIGHLPVNMDGMLCKCGAMGCWETEIGEEALLRRCSRPPDGGRAAIQDVLEDAARGDRNVLGAMGEQGRWIGIGLAGLVNVLDPSTVVLGGLLERIYPHVIESIQAELQIRVMPAIREGVHVVPAALGVDAPLLGAAELAWEPILTDPAAANRWRVAANGP